MKFITLTDPLPYQACVATIGFFDGVHRGHRFLIRQLTRYAAGHDLASFADHFPYASASGHASRLSASVADHI